MGKKSLIHQYFLTESDPFSQKRSFNAKSMRLFLVALLTVSVVAILFIGGSAERKEAEKPMTDSEAVDRMKGVSESQGKSSQMGSAAVSTGSGPGSFYSDYGNGHKAGSLPMMASRQYTASQLVKPGDGGAGSGDKLPIGTTIELKLMNRVLSSDSAAPVIALVTGDVLWKDSIVIPEGTKAIGQASLDDTSQRLQIRFNTFVFPEGEEHAVSGIGLLGDGSSGLPGDYHTGETKKEIGSFISTFVGGLAEGMQDREAAGQLGITFAPGSLRNGVLGGLGQSALNQGKLYADSLGKARPYLDVPAGATFLLYLEREF